MATIIEKTDNIIGDLESLVVRRKSVAEPHHTFIVKCINEKKGRLCKYISYMD